MTKGGAVAVGVIGILIGVVLGGIGTFRFLSPMQDTSVQLRAEGELASALGILRRIQSGEISTAELLVQGQLDGTLIALDALVRDGHTLSPLTYERIEQLRRIRQERPYESSEPTVAAAVSRALEIRPPSTQ